MVVYKRANRQYVAMSEDEVWKFLESQNKVYAGFTMKNGYPHVSPLWFCVENRKTKVELARTGKACCATDDGFLYRELRGVIVWGRSRVLTDQGLIRHVNEILDKKYEKQQWKPADMPRGWVAERRREARAFIEVTPQRVDSWDNSKV